MKEIIIEHRITAEVRIVTPAQFFKPSFDRSKWKKVGAFYVRDGRCGAR